MSTPAVNPTAKVTATTAATNTKTPTDVLKVSILGKDAIHCGFHLIPYIAQTVVETLASSTYVLVTDTNVAKFHLPEFERGFEAASTSHAAAAAAAADAAGGGGGARPRFLSYVVPPGEQTKSREGKAEIEDYLLANRCTRDTVILALGGGVIGDLVGFVAATFMRGVRFVQIPTTLLAMVDSSVGGKTAIDTPHGKNLIGAFWQPEYIFIDAAFLETLPPREFSNGMAEVVKTAAIWNETEFASLESHSVEIFNAIQTPSQNHAGRTTATRSPAQDLLLSVIVGSIGVKAHIVTIDERETGLRNLVNFGHTIGHAIEAVLTPAILHGECVSVGMVLESEVARQLGILSQVGVGRLTRALKAYNLPVTLADPRIARVPAARLLTVERLLDIMKIDKKNSGAEKKIVLLRRIGETHEPRASVVRDDVIGKTLAEAATVIAGAPRNNPVVMTTPGSKSISNRALVLAALAQGTCRLKNLLHSDDTQVMMSALIELKGASFAWEDAGETLVVTGGGGSLSVPPKGKELYLGNAGTAARFLTTVCALVRRSPSDTAPTTVITGNARMKQRPIGPLVAALRANGSPIDYVEADGCLPLSIAPAGLLGGKIELAASVSSQYVSSILLCAPYALAPVTLALTGGQVISQPYIDMTIAMMHTFGITVVRRTDPASGRLLDVYDIPQGVYRSPGVYHIESDASSATYPLAIAAATGTTCTIRNIGAALQGDAQFAKLVLERMGCVVSQTADGKTVTGPPVGGLKPLEEIDMETMTDAFLTATVLAAVATASPAEGGGGGARNEKNKTRIVGIANQRVKECNRIRAMMDQLAKFGVETNELDDGLEIYGRPVAELKRGVSVHCYDDHRVAMAFSVLGSLVEGTIIEEKRCVEKTWPSWWDDLENKIGISVKGVDLASLHSQGSTSASAATPGGPLPPNPSVVLIGMRGSGKSHVGALAAAALEGYTYLDADAHFEQKHPVGIRQYIQQHGWAAFRQAEHAILDELLADAYARGYVLSLGGGIVETPAAREQLCALKNRGGLVVHVDRDIAEIVEYLGAETARPAYGEPIEEVYKRRAPWYEQARSHLFVNQVGAALAVKTKSTSKREIERFFGHLTGQKLNFVELTADGTTTTTSANVTSDGQKRTYFLSLTYPDVAPALTDMDELTEGVDAVELRVDLLQDYSDPDAAVPSPAYVARQVALLREATSLPIIYTVRTQSQGGSFPDQAAKEAIDLLALGLELGVEYLDVEITLPDSDVFSRLVSRKGRSTKIIASWHDWSGSVRWTSAMIKEKYDIAARFGDVVKLVGKAQSLRDNFELVEFVDGKHRAAAAAARDRGGDGDGDGERQKPIIAINMGAQGQLSRILNAVLTPVTHPLLPFKAAPGQLSAHQIQEALALTGLALPKQFFLFGNPIAHSMSPALHNAGFERLGLPHVYRLLESEDVKENEEIKKVLGDEESFGGASVTIPFKLDVIPLLDELSEAARVIGAVNTIIPTFVVVSASDSGERKRKRKLVGDNTDWIGIRECVLAHLPGRVSAAVPRAGLVIGAGGTARAAIYALARLGVAQIYLFNRTRASAEKLAREFEGHLGDRHRVVVVDSLDKPAWSADPTAAAVAAVAPKVIVSTVPASATFAWLAETPKEEVSVAIAEGKIIIPPTLFTVGVNSESHGISVSGGGGGVVIDMAYKPVETPLLKVARESGRGRWATVPGLDVLLQQGYVQFELWTGRRPPKAVIARVVREKYSNSV